MNIKWRSLDKDEVPPVGSLMRWPPPVTPSCLAEPHILYKIEGGSAYFKPLDPNLDVSGGGLDHEGTYGLYHTALYGLGLQFADKPKKMTILI